MNEHVIVPIRKPVHHDMPIAATYWNDMHAKSRSNIERKFGHVKRFRVVSHTNLDPVIHEAFIRLLFLCEHFVDSAKHLTGQLRYPQRVKLEDIDPSMLVDCDCTWQARRVTNGKRPRE